jgi:hypothetical protein
MEDDTEQYWEAYEDEWALLGRRLIKANREKFQDMIRGLRDVCEAQELIARYDEQLFFRGRPKKTYEA